MIKRENWIDIAKGIGIIIVVMGHYLPKTELTTYIYWFHMPLYFFLSGYTAKKHDNYFAFRVWSLKKIKTLLIPYISFGLLLIVFQNLIRLINGSFQFNSFIKDGVRLIYGGQMLTGYFAVFWFVTCLLITQLVFSLIVLYVKKTPFQLLVIFVLFIIAHLETRLLPSSFNLPWNIDVVLFSLFFYAFGYYSKLYFPYYYKRISTLLIFGVINITFIIIQHNEIMNYTLDLKYRVYNNILLDIVIPASFIVTIGTLSYWLSKSRYLTSFLAYLGISSLLIMYLHLPVNLFLGNFIDYGILIFTLLGVIIPSLVYFLLKSNEYFSFLFLGSVRRKNEIH